MSRVTRDPSDRLFRTLEDLLRRLRALETRPPLEPEPWHVIGAPGEPAFENAWVNWGGGFEVAAFRKDPLGVVHVKGMVKGGTPAYGTTGIVFTLPVGYRPSEQYIFACAAAGTSSHAARVDVNVAGQVTITPEGGAGGTLWTSLILSFLP